MHNRQFRLARRFQVLALQIAQDRAGSNVPALHGLDDEGRAGNAVARREDALARGGQRVGVDGDGLPGGQAHARVARNEGQAGPLSHREDHRVAGEHVRGVRLFVHEQAPRLVKAEGGHALAFHAADVPALVAQDALEGAPGVDGHALFLGGGHFPGVGRHGLAVFQAGQVHFVAQAHGAAGHVNGHVAAAKHQHALPQRRRVARPVLVAAQAHVAQEVRVDQHAVQVRAGDGQAHPFVRADSDQHGVEAFGEHIVQVVHLVVQAQVHAQVHDVLYLALDNRGRQAVFRHAQAQHAPGDRHGLEDGNTIARAGQVLRGGEAARPRADDRHALVVQARRRLDRRARRSVDLVGDEALEGVDVDRLVEQAAIAGCLAAVIADAPADAGEGVVHLDHAQRVIPAPFADEGDIALGALPGGAGVAAGGDALLLDGVGVGNGLWVELVGGAAY